MLSEFLKRNKRNLNFRTSGVCCKFIDTFHCPQLVHFPFVTKPIIDLSLIFSKLFCKALSMFTVRIGIFFKFLTQPFELLCSEDFWRPFTLLFADTFCCLLLDHFLLYFISTFQCPYLVHSPLVQKLVHDLTLIFSKLLCKALSPFLVRKWILLKFLPQPLELF